MPVLVVASQQRELAGFKATPLRWPLDYAAQSGPFVLIANGAGPRLARIAVETALERMKCTAVVSAGYCGALDDRLRINAVVVARSVNGRPVSLPRISLPFASGDIVSLDRVVLSSREKHELASSGVIAVEMEAEGAMQAASAAGIPFFCIKVVTDRAREDLRIDFNRARSRDGRLRDLAVVREAMRAPLRGLPELVRLASRSRAAAFELGEFIGACCF